MFLRVKEEKETLTVIQGVLALKKQTKSNPTPNPNPNQNTAVTPKQPAVRIENLQKYVPKGKEASFWTHKRLTSIWPSND